MKRFCKKLLVFFACFFILLSLFRSFSSYAYDSQDIATAINNYRLFMETEQTAILSRFYTYSFVSVNNRSGGEVTRTYNFNLVVSDIQRVNDYDYVTISGGSVYYDSNDFFVTPHLVSGHCRLYSDRIYILSNYYYFDVESYPNRNEIIYCDLTSSYFSDPISSDSLISRDLLISPPSSVGSINFNSSDLAGNIDNAYSLVLPPQPPVTLPPFIPPATVPPSTSPPDIVTVLPPETDKNGTYIIDYSPYISADFYEPPETSDIYSNSLISPTSEFLSTAWDWLKNIDTDFFALLISLMLLSFAISMLI